MKSIINILLKLIGLIAFVLIAIEGYKREDPLLMIGGGIFIGIYLSSISKNLDGKYSFRRDIKSWIGKSGNYFSVHSKQGR